MEQELHPFEQSSDDNRFQIKAKWFIQGKKLHLHSTCIGNIGELNFKTSPHPQATDELWKLTCFECFLLNPATHKYEEWNFSPGGDYQRYKFSNYRARDFDAPRPLASDFQIKWTHSPSSLEAQVEIPISPAMTKIQISWVISTKDGTTRYWALAHPKTKPDFHDSSAFVDLSQ